MTALPPGEIAAMTAIGERIVAELRPFAEMDAAGQVSAHDVTAILVSKVLDCVLLALDDQSITAIYAGVGLVLGCCYAQQTAEVKAQLDDILDRAITAGMNQGDGGPQVAGGRA